MSSASMQAKMLVLGSTNRCVDVQVSVPLHETWYCLRQSPKRPSAPLARGSTTQRLSEVQSASRRQVPGGAGGGPAAWPGGSADADSGESRGVRRENERCLTSSTTSGWYTSRVRPGV